MVKTLSRSGSFLAFLLMMLTASVAEAEPKKRNYLCVFDPVGRNGDVYSTARDIVTDYLDLGVNFRLYPYSTESAAKADFKSGLCDGVVLTGFNSREFNRFASSIEAAGAVLDYESLESILSTLMQPKAAPLFVEDGYEVSGIYPAGAIYLHVRDKALKQADAFEGRNMFILHGDPVSTVSAEVLGANGIKGDTSNFARMLKRGKVDATFSPIVMTEPLELDKAIEGTGGIIRFPVFYLTLQVIIRPESFPEGFGQRSRELSLNHFERALDISLNAEAKVDQYWLDLNDEERENWSAVQELIREEMETKGIYDSKMLKILKKFRCLKYPDRAECAG